jgi:REP element-mobilizing transposase RayT
MRDMARKLRVEYVGAIYHVMNRGDRREPIFKDDGDRQCFMKTLAECCVKTDWQAYAWCLMPNHFHLVISTPKPNLVLGMKWLLGTYTGRFNRRHKLSGHVFGGRYKALIVDGGGNGYLRAVCDYVHLNPVRAGLLSREQKLSTYPWSSYRHYLQQPARRASWLRVEPVFGEMRIPRDTAAARKEFERQMELRRWEKHPEEWQHLRRGWCLGDDAFRKELLVRMADQAGASHYGEELRESAEEKAQKIVAEEMKRIGWSEKDLRICRKGDPQKVSIARRLRQETTMTLKWIAHRLQMGTWTHVTNRLYHLKNQARVNTKD